jgi:hypothetical protein
VIYTTIHIIIAIDGTSDIMQDHYLEAAIDQFQEAFTAIDLMQHHIDHIWEETEDLAIIDQIWEATSQMVGI